MTRAIFLPAAILLLGAMPYGPIPSMGSHYPDSMSIYRQASLVTGAPEAVIKGIAFAESSYRANPKHADPLDKGMFGLHESPEIRAERVAAWGDYDPLDPEEAAIIAGHIYMHNLARLGSSALAVAAYKQGVRGVLRDGADWEYVGRVGL